MKNTMPVLKELLKDVRENHFNNDGTYKGVPLSTSGFLESMGEFDGNTSLRKRFLIHHFNTSKEYPKVSGSYSIHDFQHGDIVDDLPKESFFSNHGHNIMHCLGSSMRSRDLIHRHDI